MVICGMCSAVPVADAAEPDRPVFPNPHPEAQWFPKAGLGLFVHWGLSSVDGKVELSWGMLKNVPWDSNHITPEQYFKLADRFNPDKYDPDKWLSAAKRAGFQYAVLTARHHEGYSLWPSKPSKATGYQFGTATHMGGRDLVRPFVEACRRNDMRVGLYYSPGDWYYERNYRSFNYKGEPLGLKHEPVERPPMPEELRAGFGPYVLAQIKELLTWYGKIDVLWFDGGPNVISIPEIRELQPWIVVNPRMHGSGDFETPEWEFPGRMDGWWENCVGWGGGWAYKSDERYKSTSWALTRLAKCRGFGGNLLLNVGPRPNGELPDIVYKQFAEMEQWMQHSGKSLIGAEAGPWPEKGNVPITVRADTWYLHVLPDHKDPITLAGVAEPEKVTLSLHKIDVHVDG